MFIRLYQKTQISTLINGSRGVVRNIKDEKYLACPKGTSSDFAGTPLKEREEIANKVKDENPDELHVVVRGVNLTLKASKTVTSQRIISYDTEISAEQWQRITGYIGSISDYKYETRFEFHINTSMMPEVSLYARKTEGAVWKWRSSSFIDESFITIL